MPAGQTESRASVAGDCTAAEASAAGAAWGALYELVFSRQSRERLHDACESLGLTPGLMKALLSVEPGEPRPMKELAGEWRCDASYVTSLVDGLEERGIVERRTHPEDRRAKVVVLTSLGERTRRRLLERMHEPPACFDALTPSELSELRDLLGKLVAAAAIEA